MGVVMKNLLIKEPFDSSYVPGRLYAMGELTTNGMSGKFRNVLALQVNYDYGKDRIYIWSLPWEYLVNPDGNIVKPYHDKFEVNEREHVACITLMSLLYAENYETIRELSKEGNPDRFTGWGCSEFEKARYAAELILKHATVPEKIIDNMYRYGTDPEHGDWLNSVRTKWF